jgi:hypothetical protein
VLVYEGAQPWGFCIFGQLTILSLGERVAPDAAFISWRGTGEGVDKRISARLSLGGRALPISFT